MGSLIPIALVGWTFVVLLFFQFMTARRAVIASFIGAWLFLPQAGINITGLPDLTKTTVAAFAALAGVALFDAGRLVRFRPRWLDLPMLAWCLVPIASSVTNGLGLYDGVSFALTRCLMWGVPYLMGRMYLDSIDGLRDLAMCIFIGGLIYVPLCLIEVRLSPQLHRWVYGYHASAFVMTRRYGGFRPTVFMQHGLMVGLWMASATVVGAWLWATGAVKRVRGIPQSLLVPACFITTVLCKSTGAVGLLICSLGYLFVNRKLRLNWLILVVVATIPFYMVIRVKGMWHGEQAVSFVEQFDGDRARSLAFRLDNEDLIIGRAMKRPLLGWGAWGRWRVRDDDGKDITVSDGLWVIALGRNGLVGLSALTIALLLPIVLFVRSVPARLWSHPALAPGAAIAMLLLLYAIDNLFNAMVNPVYMIGAGGLCSFYLATKRRARCVTRPVPVPRPLAPPVPATMQTATPPVMNARGGRMTP